VSLSLSLDSVYSCASTADGNAPKLRAHFLWPASEIYTSDRCRCHGSFLAKARAPAGPVDHVSEFEFKLIRPVNRQVSSFRLIRGLTICHGPHRCRASSAGCWSMSEAARHPQPPLPDRSPKATHHSRPAVLIAVRLNPAAHSVLHVRFHQPRFAAHDYWPCSIVKALRIRRSRLDCCPRLIGQRPRARARWAKFRINPPRPRLAGPRTPPQSAADPPAPIAPTHPLSPILHHPIRPHRPARALRP